MQYLLFSTPWVVVGAILVKKKVLRGAMMNTIIVGEAIFQGEAPSRHHLIGKICHTLLKPEVQTHHVISVIILLSGIIQPRRDTRRRLLRYHYQTSH